MGKKITEKATGQIWTIVGDNEGHSVAREDNPPTTRPTSYRIRNEATGEERLVSADMGMRFEGLI